MLGFVQGHDVGDDLAEDPPRWRRLIPVALGIAFALALALIFVLASRAEEARDRALTLRQHSYDVIILARNAQKSAARAESLLARYVVSLDPNDGRRYTDEWQRTRTILESLRRTVRGNPAQERNIAALQAAYRERGAIFDDIALRTSYDQRLGALGRFYEAGQAADADRVDNILTRMIDHERALLGRRSTMVDLSQMRVDQLSGSFSLLLVLLLAAVLLALWVANGAFAERRFARRLAAAEARRVDDLEVAVRDRTRELEVANVRLRKEMEERAQAEENLRQMHKMEAVGQLTGGIAHDFNNMLAIVTGGLELAKRRLGDSAEAARHIDNAMEGASRAASLTRRLLAFARAEPTLPGAVDPDRLIQEMSELLDRTIGDQIQVVMRPGAGDWRIWVDHHQLENALVNLCVNARDAMEGRGTLTIATGRASLAAGEVNGCAGGDYVRLSVQDTGHGMSAEVLERVFEPFFTTKPVGKGTGLGLSQVFGYVGQCKGGIRIHSSPGEGTEVEIFLPRDLRENVAARPATPKAAAGDQCAPRRSIFVVEDDPRVLAATLSALEELGHHCVSCDAPTKAADLLAAHPDLEVILTDVIMPEMTGPEMIAGLRARGLALPVIFVTGFAGDDAQTGLLDGEIVLRKPFTLAQLDRTIARAMDQHAPQPGGTSAQPGGVAFSA